ncbi:hypothetical protein EDD18DRAFT_1162586 [Armillaria luteobubalina]|uniref:Peptidase C14 caspase domain-containing protein n=1 Tax=Armillaria luteobubalina TaxID=153913 RepID=A0AA39Q754_9AGAR|nr:hypothetical protein EDD18DRAFT_1162586 [Armillaria luteobubalina]
MVGLRTLCGQRAIHFLPTMLVIFTLPLKSPGSPNFTSINAMYVGITAIRSRESFFNMTSSRLLANRTPVVSPVRVATGNSFWAVVIGIDDYQGQPLAGCVFDATSFFQYLTADLRVPTDHVALLLGTTPQSCNQAPDATSILATRANIVDTFLRLSTNPQIQNGDNIIIYFSGHGACYRCCDYDPYKGTIAETGTIEALCPMDRNPNAQEANKLIPDISDREISTILAEIHRIKGHHITVILDCCHASGVTRDVPIGRSLAVARQVRPLYTSGEIAAMLAAGQEILEKLEKNDDGSSRYKSIFEGDWKTVSKGIHVMLAACRSFELATEVRCGENTHGVFTEQLLRKLREVGVVGELPTYLAFAKDIGLSELKQYPMVVGDNKGERLWFTVRPRACC